MIGNIYQGHFLVILPHFNQHAQDFTGVRADYERSERLQINSTKMIRVGDEFCHQKHLDFWGAILLHRGISSKE